MTLIAALAIERCCVSMSTLFGITVIILKLGAFVKAAFLPHHSRHELGQLGRQRIDREADFRWQMGRLQPERMAIVKKFRLIRQ